jgi:hypothetical protein
MIFLGKNRETISLAKQITRTIHEELWEDRVEEKLL